MSRTTDERVKRLYVRKKPSFSATGTTTVNIGRSRWHVAPDWPVAFTMDGKLAWVLLPGNDLRLLSQSGEIVGTPPAILEEMRRRLFNT